MVGVLAGVLMLANGVAQADVSMAFVTVGNPGNAADQNYNGFGNFGSVPYVYQMGKYDVTVGQYCQFLNAVAKSQ